MGQLEKVFLSHLRRPQATPTEVAPHYVDLMRAVRDEARDAVKAGRPAVGLALVDWEMVNFMVVRRWGWRALERVKAMARLLLEADEIAENAAGALAAADNVVGFLEAFLSNTAKTSPEAR